jgi:hypothetical protein
LAHPFRKKSTVRRREYAFTGCRWMCNEGKI